MLSVRELTKVHRGRSVVADVSFDLRPGTVTALLGPSGSGKSTLLGMITGLTRPSRGCAWIAGRPFADWPNPAHVAGVLPAVTAAHPGRTGRAHLRTAAVLAGVSATHADAALARVGLAEAANRSIRGYSPGMRRRLGLAHALLTDPPLLILDDPFAKLDPDSVRALRDLLRAHVARGGEVLLAGDAVTGMDGTVDRILMISGGRIMVDAPAGELLSSDRSLISGPDMAALAEALHQAGVAIRPHPDGRILAAASREAATTILDASGHQEHSVVPDQQSLEELFHRLSVAGAR